MPEVLAGVRVGRDDARAEEIVAVPVSAVLIDGGRAERHVDDAALGIDEWIAALVNVLDDVIQAHLELREAVVPEGTDLSRCSVGRLRHVRRRRAVLNAMAVVGEGIRAGVADPLAVVFLQAGKVSVSDRDHFLAR